MIDIKKNRAWLYAPAFLLALAIGAPWLHQLYKNEKGREKPKTPYTVKSTLQKLGGAEKLLRAFYNEHKRYPTEEEFQAGNLDSIFEPYTKNKAVIEGKPVAIGYYFIDPCDGDIFRYNTISPNEIRLYGVGPDGKDNSGSPYNPETWKGDIILHLKDNKRIDLEGRM